MRGNLTRLFIGAAVGLAAVTYSLSDQIGQAIVDHQHEPVQSINGGESFRSATSIFRGGGSESPDGIQLASQTIPVAEPALPDHIDPEIEWMDVHSMNDPKIRMYLAKKAYHNFKQETSAQKKHEALSDLKWSLIDYQEDWEKFSKDTTLSKTDFFAALGEYSAKAVAELKQRYDSAPPGDMVGRVALLEQMLTAYNDVTTTPDGMVYNGGPEGEAARKAITGIDYDYIINPLKDLRQSAAEQGFATVAAYARATPQDQAAWERYSMSYQAVSGYLSYAKIHEKQAAYAQLGITEEQWDTIRARSKELYDIQRIKLLEEQGIPRPAGHTTVKHAAVSHQPS